MHNSSSAKGSIWRHSGLLVELTKREFSGRYRGSFGGILWSLFQPLFLLLIYTFVFGVILKSRWGFSGGTADYAFVVFAGLIVFNAFSEVLTKSPMLVVNNPNFVKKIIFPLGLLPVISVVTALIHALIGITVWLIGYILIIGPLKTTVLLFPLVLICLIPLLLGVGWVFSAVGVLVRDISQFTAILNHTLLFLTPIFYSIEVAPPPLQALLMLNPLTFIVEQLRLILYYGQVPALDGLAIYFLLAYLFSWSSFILFQRLRPNFADML